MGMDTEPFDLQSYLDQPGNYALEATYVLKDGRVYLFEVYLPRKDIPLRQVIEEAEGPWREEAEEYLTVVVGLPLTFRHTSVYAEDLERVVPLKERKWGEPARYVPDREEHPSLPDYINYPLGYLVSEGSYNGKMEGLVIVGVHMFEEEEA